MRGAAPEGTATGSAVMAEAESVPAAGSPHGSVVGRQVQSHSNTPRGPPLTQFLHIASKGALAGVTWPPQEARFGRPPPP